MRSLSVRRSFGMATLLGAFSVAAWAQGCGETGDTSLFGPGTGEDSGLADATFSDAPPFGSTGGSSNGGNNGGDGSTGNPGPRTDAGDFIFDAEVEDVPPLPDARFVYTPPVRDAAINADSACAATRAEAALRPLDMFIMFDKSGSMNDPEDYSTTVPGDCNYVAGQAPARATRWCHAVNALGGYITAAAADVQLRANRIGLQFFPKPADAAWTCTARAVTDTASLAHPNATPIGFQLLQTSSATLISALNTEKPDGNGTPILHALNGIYGFYDVVANRDPNRTKIAIFMTDGEPNSCGNSGNTATTLRDVAQDMFNAHAIPTYVIGMNGASFTTLETIAGGGNAPVHNNSATTPCGPSNNPPATCRHYDVRAGDPQVFINVLTAIQRTAIGCTYDMPKTDAGIVNPNRISVEYRLTPSGASVAVPRVTASGNCTGSGGYYFDNNTTPTKVNLCPATCTTVQASSTAKVEVLVACQGS